MNGWLDAREDGVTALTGEIWVRETPAWSGERWVRGRLGLLATAGIGRGLWVVGPVSDGDARATVCVYVCACVCVCVCVCVWRERESSKTLFYKDCN